MYVKEFSHREEALQTLTLDCAVEDSVLTIRVIKSFPVSSLSTKVYAQPR